MSRKGSTQAVSEEARAIVRNWHRQRHLLGSQKQLAARLGVSESFIARRRLRDIA